MWAFFTTMARWLLWGAAASTVALSVAAKAAGAPAVREEKPEKIRDNLFLLEEAYNQEPGVIQHIQSFIFNPRAESWSYSFTEEWPVPTDLHQLSITVPAFDAGKRATPAISDILLNYRLQAVGAGGAGSLAVAPRLSLVLPTGDYRTGAGRGTPGVQANVPASVEIGKHFVTHLNAGFTLTPEARSPGGHRETAVDTNVGAALVWLPLTWANALVEVALMTTEDIRDDRGSGRRSVLAVNPGVRFAIDFKSGLQIVPGISAPIQLTDDGTEFSGLFYLSLEHPVWNPSVSSSAGGPVARR